MYAWIWRKLPFGLPGKLFGSVTLVGGTLALLWFVVFPWADPFLEERLLPWNEGQIEGDFAPGGPAGSGSPDGDPPPDVDEELLDEDGNPIEDEHFIPYDTGE